MLHAWQPQTAGVNQICHLLSEYQKPGTNQAQILAQLDQCKAFPDFNNYLAFIFAQGDGYPIEVRQSAGLLLKNNLKEQYAATSDEFKSFIKLALLHAIGNPSKALRHTVGTNITVIVGAAGLASWPELISTLVQCLESNDAYHLEGALDTLYKICEEQPLMLEQPVTGLPDTPSNVLVPRLLQLFTSSHQDAKCLAVGVLNLLAGGMPAALQARLDQYLQGLFSLAHDEWSDVRKAVCAGLVQMLHLQPESLHPHMNAIVSYMLTSTQDGDEGVALESCEFWSAFCEANINRDVLRPYLTQLIPVLLSNMVYDEYDEEVAEAELAEDMAQHNILQNDKDQDMKPFHSSRAGRGAGVADEEDSDTEETNKWNLRKCSAAGLDVLSTVFGDELLPIVLPTVQTRLQEADWRARESAILALGAISEGCAMGLMPFLQDMVNMLLPKLSDPRPLVRSITCWALSRYSHYIIRRSRDDEGMAAQQLDAVVQGLLIHVLDHNPRVQEAACSALATLEEEAGVELMSRMKAILQTLAQACRMYGRKNLRILYDAISTLAESVGRALADPQLVSIFMPPLVEKWNSIADTDRELLPLMECFTAIAQAFGSAFEMYAVITFERCIRVIGLQLAAKQALAAGQPSEVEVDREFVVCSLDLISGMAEALGPSIESLVGRSPLREMLLHCCQDNSPDVRQSAFALVGDLSKACASHLQPAFTQLVTSAIQNLDLNLITAENMSACNNACWALGELAVKCPPEKLQNMATAIVERLAGILAQPAGSMPRSIVENSAITLGRVGWMCPEQIARYLNDFVWHWCNALHSIRDDLEKEHAFLGLCRLIRLNPEGALGAFDKLCEAVVSWRDLRCEGLANEIMQVMHVYKEGLTNSGKWDGYLQGLEPAVRDKLITMCKL